MHCDVAVVGCGPAGSLASLEAAEKGARVLVLEEHGTIGEPDHCAGLVSISGLRTLGLKVPGECVLNRVYGARFVSPSGEEFIVRRREPQAVVLDRRAFDRWLASLAQDAGAQTMLGRRVTAVSAGRRGVVVSARGGLEVRCGVVVDAEGCRGRIARLAGLPRPGGRIPAVQYELAGVCVDEELVELHFGSSVAPGFFAWVIPVEGGVRVGLGARSSPGERLRSFIRRMGFSGARVVRKMAGVVITGGPVGRTRADRMLVVGDAAGQVKPTTGGGVVTGGICSRIAGRVAAEAALSGGDVNRALRAYEEGWRRVLGREFLFMKVARRVLGVVGDRGLDEVFRAVRECGGVEIIERYGDMDFEAEVIKKLLVNPRLVVRALIGLVA